MDKQDLSEQAATIAVWRAHPSTIQAVHGPPADTWSSMPAAQQFCAHSCFNRHERQDAIFIAGGEKFNLWKNQYSNEYNLKM